MTHNPFAAAPLAQPAKPQQSHVRMAAIPGGYNPDAFGRQQFERSSFFQPGIDTVDLSKGRVWRGRILPSFDYYGTAVSDPSFPMSMIPYRSTDPMQVDPKTGLGFPTPWAWTFKAYKMVGQGKRKLDITAFETRAAYARPDLDTSDPLKDAVNYLFTGMRAGKWDKAYVESFTKRTGAIGHSPDPMLPSASQLFAMNVYGSTYDPDTKVWGDPKQEVLLLSKPGFEALQTRLALRLLAGINPPDANNPHFLYGDPTNPYTGLMASTIKQAEGPSGILITTLGFASDDNNPTATWQQAPLPQELLAEILPKRVMVGLDSFKFLDYQEIVDFLLEDNPNPVFQGLIREACGHKANVNKGNPSMGMPPQPPSFGAMPSLPPAPQQQPNLFVAPPAFGQTTAAPQPFAQPSAMSQINQFAAPNPFASTQTAVSTPQPPPFAPTQTVMTNPTFGGVAAGTFGGTGAALLTTPGGTQSLPANPFSTPTPPPVVPDEIPMSWAPTPPPVQAPIVATPPALPQKQYSVCVNGQVLSEKHTREKIMQIVLDTPGQPVYIASEGDANWSVAQDVFKPQAAANITVESAAIQSLPSMPDSQVQQQQATAAVWTQEQETAFQALHTALRSGDPAALDATQVAKYAAMAAARKAAGVK